MKRFYKFLMPLVAIVALALPWASRAQDTVTIGTGTSASYYIPFNSLYGYSFTEMVYLATDIDMAGQITEIQFYLDQSYTSAQTNTIALYMKNVTRSNFSSSTDIESVTASDIVYSGSWTIPANYTGWVSITLDTPFDYDGSSNLMVAMHESTSGYSTRNFRYTSVSNSGVQLYSDSYNPDPYNPGSYSGSKTLRSYLANMKIAITSGTISCYRVKNLAASGIDPWNCTLSWLDTNNSGPTYVIVDMADTSELATTTDTFYTFSNLVPDTTYHFGVFVDCGGDSTRINLINVTTPPACAVVTNLEAATTAGSAILTWTPSISDSNSSNIVEYRADTADTWIQLGSFTEPTATITGLDAGTAYVARVAGYCFSEYTSNWQTVSFTTAELPCALEDGENSHTATVGNGTSTTSYFPTYSLYNYCYTQQIFTPTELGGAGSLHSISVFPTSVYSQRNIEIYVGHVNVATSSSWLNPADLTLVYTGTTNYVVNEWYTFNFTTPFAYNGNDNLLVVFRDQTGTWTTSNVFQCTAGTSGVSCYVYQDASAYTVPPSTSGYSSNNRCNMIFDMSGECLQTATCAAPYVVVDSVEATEVTVSWVPGYDETSWNLEYRLAGSTAWSTADLGVSTTTYTFTNLDPATWYDLRVVTPCSDTSFGSMVTVFTNCVTIENLQEDFNSYATGSSADFNECWTKNVSGTTTAYPYVNTIGDQKAMYFYGYNYSNSTHYSDWLITPEFSDSLNTKKLEFDMYRTSTTNNYTARLIIGAVADPSSITHMDTIAVVDLTTPTDAGVWMHQNISLENYHGNGTHLVFLAPSVELFVAGNNYSYNVFYIDNIFVENIDACPRPTRFHARDIMSNSAQLAWDDNSEYSNVMVKWGTSNSIATATDSMIVTGANELDLLGLNANTTYYCWITAICNTDASFTMSCSFHTAANCNPVVNLTANEVTNNVATFSWSNDEVSPATSYKFSWKADSVQTWNNVITNNTFYMLSGLSEGTTYNVKVAAMCSDDSSNAVTLSVTTTTPGTIGTDEGTYYLPTYPYYEYSISEQMWTANELAEYGDTVNGIYFYATSAIADREMQIWVVDTTLADLSTTSYVPSTAMTLVMDSTYDIVTGWNYFPFDAPYVRDVTKNFVVLTYDNTGEYESFDGFSATTSPVNSLYDYQDGTPYSTTDLSDLTSASVRAMMRLNATMVQTTCRAPHPVVANATESTVTVAWMPGDNETSWMVEYRGMTDTAWTVVVASTTDTFATATNLAAATRYFFRITSLCSGETASATLLGRTTCGAFTVPYTEDFNTMSTNDYVMNACWTKGTTGTGDTPYTVNITNEGMMSVMPRGSYIIFPTMNLPVSDLQLRMRYVAADTNIYSLVGVCTHPGDIYSFVPIDTIWCETAGVGAWSTTVFEDYTGTTGQIAIYSWYNQSYIDDINIEVAPSCKAVTTMTLANATTNTATLEWNAAPNATSYILNYWLAGDSTVTTQAITGTTATLTGLQHSATYMATVTTICSLLGDTSLASNVLTFKTECAPVALPYTQDFDHCNAPALTYTGILPNCWSTAHLGTGTYAGSNYRAQIYSSSSYAHSGQYSLMMYGNAIVLLPEMPTSVDSLQLSFHEYNTSYNYYGLIIGVCDSNTPGFEASFVPVDTLLASGTQNDYTTYALASYAGTGRYIAFKNFYTTSSSTQYSVHYIDDVVVDYLPSCLPVLNVHATASTPTTVNLTWDDLHPATEWEVVYSSHALTNATMGTGTSVIVNSNPATINGLSGDTTYYFYVRTICGTGDTATWSTGFATRPGSWTMRANQTDTLTLCGGTIYDDGGATGNYTNNQDSYIILQPSGSSIVEVSGTVNAESNWDYLHIYDGIGTNGTVLWEGSTGSFTGLASTTGPLTIYFEADGSNNYSGFEIHVNCVSNACPISNIHYDTASYGSSSVTVAWTGSSSSYEIEYGPAGFTQGTGTTATTNTNSFNMSGLSGLMSYDVYVRGICDPDTSRWFFFTFQTALCDNPTVATTGNPDSTTTTSYNAPVNNYYHYTLSQTLIDSAELGGPMDITAIAYYYNYSSPSTVKNDVTIWLQPTNKTSFASTTDLIALDTTIAVQVYHGNLNCSQGWNYFGFSNTFSYNGVGNLVVIVDDNSDDYNGSSYVFKTMATTEYKTITRYSDSYHVSPFTPTATSASTTRYQWRPVMQLISCGAGCAAPTALTATNVTYNAATITWTGSDSTEVGIHQGLWDLSGATMANVTPGVHTYTFTGLTPNTQYTVAARTLCEDNMTSNWTFVTFTTEDLPCFAPSNIQVSNATPNGGKVTWTPGGNETEWLVNVFRTGIIDTNITVINTPMCNISGLYAATSYTISVGSVCGGIDTVWCDTTATLTTTACLPPTNVTAVANGHTAIVTWEGSGANEYHVLWYLEDFTTGADSVVVENGTTNATITGLEQGETYDIYVFAYCDGQRSAQAGQTQVTITGIDDVNSSLINLYPNPANTTVTVDGIQGEAIVTIVDMNGRTVFSEKAVSKLTIDLNGMAQGAYFVRITGENTTAIRKLIVK